MNDQLIGLSDESLDQVAGGALITLDVSGTVKGVVKGVASVGEAAFGLFGAVLKFGGQVAKAGAGLIGAVVEIR
jgi:hypothetical protein